MSPWLNSIKSQNATTMRNYLLIICISYYFLPLLVSCQQSNEIRGFDFSEFEKAGLTSPDRNKFLTYIKATKNNMDGFTFVCQMYTKDVTPYLESPNVDVLFLIYADKKDLMTLRTYLENWCFSKYIITHKTPAVFNPVKYPDVKGISFYYDKLGNEVALTNPSQPNFHRLMKRKP